MLIWDFCAAVLSGEAKPALAQLSALLAQEESEVGILILLAGQVRLAALAAVLRENQMLRLKGGAIRVGGGIARRARPICRARKAASRSARMRSGRRRSAASIGRRDFGFLRCR